ncbi:MAG TPA: iron-containing alcohol dehydrogenase [Candidatus Blautia stercoravium]|nr:iron-containing alcohol dehydrogenase [Candidatus Blautia stercoravium]
MIQMKAPYPSDFDAVVDQNHEEINKDILPKLVENNLDLSRYDAVFIGYPIWATKAPQAIFSFLSEYDLSGKHARTVSLGIMTLFLLFRHALLRLLFGTEEASVMSDMYALTAIENIGAYLPRAVQDGTDLEAREHVAFANTLSGVVMTVSACTSEHSMEHAMSAYHHELPHGAGLIMISQAYFTHFIEKHTCDERFVRMAQALGKQDAKEPMDFITALGDLQEVCGVSDLKMSDYGISPDEFLTLAQNARTTMGGLFACDRVPLSDEECAAIFEKSYR